MLSSIGQLSKIALLILLLSACARTPLKKGQEEISVFAALNQAQMSYLKGCVEAHKSLKLGPSFETCRDRAKAHRLELDEMMDYNEEK